MIIFSKMIDTLKGINMLNNLIQLTSIYASQQNIRNSLKKHLNVKFINDEISRDIDKNKKYLLYNHIPFCHNFCPFCSFHKFKYDEKIAKEYFKSLRLEMRKVKDEGYSFDSIYVGGGTTLINEDELFETLTLAKKLFDIKDISCESDPNHINPEKLQRFKGLIDRLSIGIQTFDNDLLKKISRYSKFGSSESLQEKIKAIRGIFPIISIDLIFNFPSQTKELLLNDIKIAKELNIEQITMYPLMNSSLNENRMKRIFKEKNISNEKEFYSIIKKEFSDYYMNNAWSFSKKKLELSDEYLYSHNEYIGIGSGAFSYIDNNLYINAFDLEKYSSLVLERSHAIIATCSFKNKQEIQFHFLTALFNGKINIKKFDKTFNTSLIRVLNKELYLLKKAKAINIKNEYICPSEFGEYLSLILMKEFYIGMDSIRKIFKENI